MNDQRHTDAVNVLGNTTVLDTGKVKVDDVHDVDDVKTTSGEASGNHDGAPSGAEGTTIAIVREG